MTKKIITLALVLSLTLGLATAALANTNDEDSIAGIVFEAFSGDVGVFDPDPDPDDTDPLLPGIQGIDIYFWEREVSGTTQTYHSWYADAAAEIAAGFHDGATTPVHVPTTNTTHGVGTAPALARQSAAGIGVWATADWTVTAEISEFESTSGANSGNETMAGFALNLSAHNPFSNAPSVGVGGTTIVTPGTIATMYANEDLDGAMAVQVASGVVAAGQLGLAGVNYRGALTVLGGSAHMGEAEADILWTFVQTP